MGQIVGVTLSGTDGAWYHQDAEPWTPSPEDLQAAEPAVLDEIRRQAPSVFARLDEYRCQFTGVVVDGERRIFYNFFCCDDEDVNDSWRTEPVFVLDGGDDYFQLEYAPDTRTCARFTVNGEA